MFGRSFFRHRIESRRRRLAARLRGHGLEIGALANPSTIPNASRVLYSDILTAEQLDAAYPGSRHPDIISDSETFPSVPDATFDFVVANHVIEHVSSPIRALQEWHRILKPGGRVLMAVPDKRFTFDHRRSRTPLHHVVHDYLHPAAPEEMNRAHLLEWAEWVEGLAPGTSAFDRWVSTQIANGFSVHNHVWVAQDVIDMLLWMHRETPARFELEAWHNSSLLRAEVVMLLRACRPGSPSAETTLAAAGRVARLQHCWLQAQAWMLLSAKRARRRTQAGGLPGA